MSGRPKPKKNGQVLSILLQRQTSVPVQSTKMALQCLYFSVLAACMKVSDVPGFFNLLQSYEGRDAQH